LEQIFVNIIQSGEETIASSDQKFFIHEIPKQLTTKGAEANIRLLLSFILIKPFSLILLSSSTIAFFDR